MRSTPRPRIGIFEAIDRATRDLVLDDLRRNFKRKSNDELIAWLEVLNDFSADRQPYTIGEIRA